MLRLDENPVASNDDEGEQKSFVSSRSSSFAASSTASSCLSVNSREELEANYDDDNDDNDNDYDYDEQPIRSRSRRALLDSSTGTSGGEVSWLETMIIHEYDPVAAWQDVWYTPEEYDFMKVREWVVLELVQTGHFTESEAQTFRGLEHKLMAKQIQSRRKKALEAVLDLQDQCSSPTSRTSSSLSLAEMIAARYQQTSRVCCEEARVVGQRDAEDALEYLKACEKNGDFLYLSRWLSSSLSFASLLTSEISSGLSEISTGLTTTATTAAAVTTSSLSTSASVIGKGRRAATRHMKAILYSPQKAFRKLIKVGHKGKNKMMMGMSPPPSNDSMAPSIDSMAPSSGSMTKDEEEDDEEKSKDEMTSAEPLMDLQDSDSDSDSDDSESTGSRFRSRIIPSSLPSQVQEQDDTSMVDGTESDFYDCTQSPRSAMMKNRASVQQPLRKQQNLQSSSAKKEMSFHVPNRTDSLVQMRSNRTLQLMQKKLNERNLGEGKAGQQGDTTSAESFRTECLSKQSAPLAAASNARPGLVSRPGLASRSRSERSLGAGSSGDEAGSGDLLRGKERSLGRAAPLANAPGSRPGLASRPGLVSRSRSERCLGTGKGGNDAGASELSLGTERSFGRVAPLTDASGSRPGLAGRPGLVSRPGLMSRSRSERCLGGARDDAGLGEMSRGTERIAPLADASVSRPGLASRPGLTPRPGLASRSRSERCLGLSRATSDNEGNNGTTINRRKTSPTSASSASSLLEQQVCLRALKTWSDLDSPRRLQSVSSPSASEDSDDDGYNGHHHRFKGLKQAASGGLLPMLDDIEEMDGPSNNYNNTKAALEKSLVTCLAAQQQRPHHATTINHNAITKKNRMLTASQVEKLARTVNALEIGGNTTTSHKPRGSALPGRGLVRSTSERVMSGIKTTTAAVCPW